MKFVVSQQCCAINTKAEIGNLQRGSCERSQAVCGYLLLIQIEGEAYEHRHHHRRQPRSWGQCCDPMRQARHGVILTYNNNPEAAENVVRSIEAEGGKVAALKLDVGDSGSFAAFRDTVRVTLGKVWESNLLSSFSSIHATSKDLRVAMRRAAIMPGPPDAGRRHRPG
ncbi:hypothetical protein [Rhizobium sp. ARZ01]|uniref:hypothetical protein n=1 Tax=Rhizobium sp. ARZ01 TaxID=2769313 RepID=UPI001FEE67FB|nr:hypothetical protein [Rhizobium sp. ARZ01]